VDPRPWLLAIVRNTCWTWLRANRSRDTATILEGADEPVEAGPSAEEDLLRRADGARLTRALEELSAEFREVVVLREIEELSYREIAEVAGIPVGTVMSRLARARKRMQFSLARPAGVRP
jgi:RNA polymerase sigma-70 factor, ECF subfamily